VTTRRVLIDANAGSPFRVSASGVDAAGAQFDSLIFDANQPPIRIYLNSWMRVPVPGGGLQLATWAAGPSYPAVPGGTHPMFLTMWWQPNFASPASDGNRGASPLGTGPCFTNDATFGQGAGGAVGDGIFAGISFVKSTVLPSGQPVTFPDDTHIGLVLMRNYQ